MECNKDEAVRAKSIAEKKMQDKDFSTARKLVLKAQQLYEDLENISQMLIVCHVHCSADQKLFGKEMDWYGILQIEQTADESTIKRQYRKLALQLHPDKNKFPGAEAAFKLIGEAQMVLLDKGKRKLHDDLRKSAVCKPVVPYQRPPRTTNNSNFAVQNHSKSNFTGFNSQGHQTQYHANARLTFWTACPSCYAMYQYYIDIVNKPVTCQKCRKPFIAFDRAMPGAPINSNQPPFHQRRDVPDQGSFKVESEVRMNFTSVHLKKEKLNRKRKKMQQEESGESCDSGSSNDTEDDMHIDRDGDFKVKLNPGHTAEGPRRSDRHRQKVSYKENLSDDDDDDDDNEDDDNDDGDFVNSLKQDNGIASSYATKKDNGFGLDENASKMHKRYVADTKIQNDMKTEKILDSNEHEIKEAKNAASNEKVGSDADCTSNSEVHHRSEFNDFDKDRSKECFSDGQIWACYDTRDAMPRCYARIMKVFSPGFKLRITWLELDPDSEQEKLRAEEKLPASCGKFKCGNSQNSENHSMFSHLVYWETGQRRNIYKIFPRKGETWALFKNWDINLLKSDLDANAKIEYECVEIMSEFSEGVGVYVTYLVKVKGFVSVFCRTWKEGKGTFQIPPGELFRFSHRVPSCKLTGEKRDDVPKGAFELDPTSLPKNMEEVAAPGDIRVEIDNDDVNGSCLKSSDDGKPKGVPGYQTSIHLADVKEADLQTKLEEGVTCVEDSDASSDSSKDIEILEPEFFNFDAEKSVEKFQVGQIWSLYSDEDSLPKYYGKITKVDRKGFGLQLRWLESILIGRKNDQILISCGEFKIKGDPCYYESADAFSHQLTTVSSTRRGEYTVLPRKGEVWALYKNWSAEMKLADLKNCEYDVVEVIEEDSSWTRVMFLERVDGFNAVFKAQMKEGSSVQLVISKDELLKFSHQIPCFRLTEERGGSLRGFWELDPAALPVRYFR